MRRGCPWAFPRHHLAGAVRLAREQGSGQTIVPLLCDSGLKYQSKLVKPEWLTEHGLDSHASTEAIL